MDKNFFTMNTGKQKCIYNSWINFELRTFMSKKWAYGKFYLKQNTRIQHQVCRE